MIRGQTNCCGSLVYLSRNPVKWINTCPSFWPAGLADGLGLEVSFGRTAVVKPIRPNRKRNLVPPRCLNREDSNNFGRQIRNAKYIALFIPRVNLLQDKIALQV